ncbi:MAG TPA: hypothetical protein VF492_08650, partial [Verrucomicrobiae bacterium]
RVMEQVKRQCSHAQIIMGAAVDGALKEKLCVTVIAAKKNESASPTSVTPRAESHLAPSVAHHREPALARQRKPGTKPVQAQLPLTIISKGRFDKSEPTLHRGEDLDVPTFIRRGVAMN